MSLQGLIVSKIGQAGLQLHPQAKEVSPWIQNMMQESDGSWRPRYGLDLVRAFTDRIAMLESTYQATDNKHYLYVMPQDSYLYEGAITEIGAAVGVSMVAKIPLANWNSEFKNAASCIAPSSNPSATEKRLCFSFPGFGVADQAIYDQNATEVEFAGGTTDVKGVPFCHNNTLAVVQKGTILWSTLGNSYNIPTSTYTNHVPEVGEGIAAAYWQDKMSFVFGTKGVYSVQGEPMTSAKFSLLTAPPLAGPAATSVCRCRDRIAYISPGPCIYMIGGGLQPIEEPIRGVLNDYVDATYFALNYDPLIDCLCVTPLVDQTVSPGVANDTYLYSLRKNRWIGTYRHADSTKGISKIVHCGPNTDSLTVPRNRPPYGCVVVAASNLLAKYSPTTYGDDNSSGTVVPFTCALETAPDGLDIAPSVTKQLIDVYVDGNGEWTVKLIYRNGTGESWTTETVGSIDAPGWVYASRDLPVYKERKIRLEASSASGLCIRNVGIRERGISE